MTSVGSLIATLLGTNKVYEKVSGDGLLRAQVTRKRDVG